MIRWMTNQVNETGHRLLAFFELVGFLFAALVIVCKQWFDEFEQLVDCLTCVKLVVVFEHCLANFKSDSAFVGELHVVHERRVVVHPEHLDRKRVKRQR